MHRKVVLSFLAHPDDAEMLCAGTLIRLADAGWEIHMATATAGDCGTTVYSAKQISAIRHEEARRAAAMIGATYHCLGELDGRVVYDKPAIQKAIELFRQVALGLVFTHARSDYMMDHEIVSVLARSGSFMYGAPNASQAPLIPGSGVPYMYYCDPVEAIDSLGRPIEPTTWIDISEQLSKKADMLACHASQREWLRAHHGHVGADVTAGGSSQRAFPLLSPLPWVDAAGHALTAHSSAAFSERYPERTSKKEACCARGSTLIIMDLRYTVKNAVSQSSFRSEDENNDRVGLPRVDGPGERCPCR